ncbi:MAG: 5-amino-6-(D-ribitylamino)uracil--L-tyrosine 4-hydroxyphenyl transferase CofH [Promethearchaeota archaeon]
MDALTRSLDGERIEEEDAHHLLGVTGWDLVALMVAANAVRERVNGDRVTFVVNRNVNFTNVCTHRCRFCAFSVPPGHPDAYFLSPGEVAAKVAEAVEAGCTEVCIQGGLHPDAGLETYEEILAAVRSVSSEVHVHAFSPEEVHHAAKKDGLSHEEVLRRLKAAGLNSVPGTAAEILVDEVRRRICPNKLSTAEWVDVVTSAHRLGLPSTATIMYGHVETLAHRARHLAVLRDVQERTGGFTEFVPLPFVAQNVSSLDVSPARAHGIGVDDLKLFAVARLFFQGFVHNVQCSWVKLGPRFAQTSLYWGVNDFSGTLMEENISRTAGAQFGQALSVEEVVAIVKAAGRIPVQRDTTYNELRVY